MTIDFKTPVLLPEHVTGAVAPNKKARAGQQVRLPDLYQKFAGSPGRLVRYRIKLDTSYLNQSEIVADVWSLHGKGWVELCRVIPDREFYIMEGPDVAATDLRCNEVTRTLSVESRGAKYVASSWQKVVNRIAAEAALLIEGLA